MKKIILVLVLLFALAGCMNSANFKDNYEKLQEIKVKFAGKNSIVPTNFKSLNAYEIELKAFKEKISKAEHSNEADALNRLIDSRLSIVKMERSILNSRWHAQNIDFSDMSCEEGNPLKQVIDDYDAAANYSELALKQTKVLKSKYPELLNSVGFESEELEITLKNITEQMEQLKKELEIYC